MFKVGLTGGIGSGKSTAANFFKQRGIQVIDLDQLAREVVEPGTPALIKILERFDENILNTDGSLDRKKLGSVVFKSGEDKEWLEKLIHPLIQGKKNQLIDSSQSEYLVIEIPLLTENRLANSVDRVLLVDCNIEAQMQRAITRGNQAPDQVSKIIKLQASRSERQNLADDILSNDSGLKELEDQVEQLHQLYLNIAKKQTNRAIVKKRS